MKSEICEKFANGLKPEFWNKLREGEKKFWLKLVLAWSNGSLIGKVDEYRNLMETIG